MMNSSFNRHHHHLQASEDIKNYCSKSPVYISELCKNGALGKAFSIVDSMEKKDIPISRDIVYNLLQACRHHKCLAYARKIQYLMVKYGFITLAPLGDQLIRLFTACGSLQEAKYAFHNIVQPTIYSWNSLISAHSKLGESSVALELYEKLQNAGIMPDRVTFVCVCNACSNAGTFLQGMLIHDQAVLNKFEADLILGNSLIDMYGNCGCLIEARRVFDRQVTQDLVSWTVMISGYTGQGQSHSALQLYRKMRQHGIHPNKAVILCSLRACTAAKDIHFGGKMHSEILELKLDTDMAIVSSLVDMYTKSASLAEAAWLFNKLPSQDIVSWGVMIDGYAQNGRGLVALQLFERMLQTEIMPNEVIYLGVLKACGTIRAILEGWLIHEQIVRQKIEIHDLIVSALVDMYAKCGHLNEAYSVFKKTRRRNVVLWGAMISGYSENGLIYPVLELFYEMLWSGIEPNRVILTAILKACSKAETLVEGMFFHDAILQSSLETDLTIGNTLVDMYSKCKNLEAAQKVFDGLVNSDSVSFGALISGYCNQGYETVAIDLFGIMQEKGVKPERATYLILLRACSNIGAVKCGRLIHEQIIKNGLDSSPLLRNSLVDMYAKTGSLKEAQKMFYNMLNQDVISCGAMIGGYTQHGDCNTATQVLEGMAQAGLKPDPVIFSNILMACSNAGLLIEGHTFFTLMKDTYGIIPTREHYTCVVDLLARAGQMYKAEDLLWTMPMVPDDVVWTSLLSCSRLHNNVDLGKRCFTELSDIVPGGTSHNIDDWQLIAIDTTDSS